jgi:aspartate 1-decarboxylase
MQRIVLKSKIHRATVTDTLLHYEGSVGIDAYLLEQADILEGEQVHIYNISSGHRFETYAIKESPHSGKIIMKGAAARLAEPGDLIIIATYAFMNDEEYKHFSSLVVKVDECNRVVRESDREN